MTHPPAATLHLGGTAWAHPDLTEEDGLRWPQHVCVLDALRPHMRYSFVKFL